MKIVKDSVSRSNFLKYLPCNIKSSSPKIETAPYLLHTFWTIASLVSQLLLEGFEDTAATQVSFSNKTHHRVEPWRRHIEDKLDGRQSCTTMTLTMAHQRTPRAQARLRFERMQGDPLFPRARPSPIDCPHHPPWDNIRRPRNNSRCCSKLLLVFWLALLIYRRAPLPTHHQHRCDLWLLSWLIQEKPFATGASSGENTASSFVPSY